MIASTICRAPGSKISPITTFALNNKQGNRRLRTPHWRNRMPKDTYPFFANVHAACRAGPAAPPIEKHKYQKRCPSTFFVCFRYEPDRLSRPRAHALGRRVEIVRYRLLSWSFRKSGGSSSRLLMDPGILGTGEVAVPTIVMVSTRKDETHKRTRPGAQTRGQRKAMVGRVIDPFKLDTSRTRLTRTSNHGRVR